VKSYTLMGTYIEHSIEACRLVGIRLFPVTAGPRGREMSEKPATNSDSTGEWRARTGTHRQIDTTKLRALDGVHSMEEGLTEAAPGSDPYNHTTSALPSPSEKSRRRSLDDMRKLSEAIKKSRLPRPQ
jgi:hypothetical protein